MWVHHDEPLSYEAWGPGNPSNHSRNSNDCGVMVLKNNQVYWEDSHCLDKDIQHHLVAPLCQYTTISNEPQTTPTTKPDTTNPDTTIPDTTMPDTTKSSITMPDTTTPTHCPDKWTQHGSGCYRYFSGRISWVSADAECLSMEGRLASVHSRHDDIFLQTLAGGDSFWLGGYPSAVETDWVWADMTVFEHYHIYDAHYDSCLYQSSAYYDYGWSSASCDSSSRTYAYICKLFL